MPTQESRPGAGRAATALLAIGLLAMIIALAGGMRARSVAAEAVLWQSIGVDSGDIRALAIDPAAPATLYAGTSTGVYKSSDGAAHWSNSSTGLPSITDGEAISALALAPSDGQTLYTSISDSRGKVYRSTDGGANWTAGTSIAESGNVLALAVDPRAATTLYAGIMNLFAPSGVYKSSDGGNSWSLVLTFPSDAGHATALAIKPHTPDTIYASGSIAHAYKSTDGGANWADTSDGLPDATLTTLIVNPTYSDVLYVGVSGSPNTSGGVYKSVNGGQHWFQVSTGLPAPNGTIISALALSPQHTHMLYAGVQDAGVYVSSDAGHHWTAANTGLPSSHSFGALAVDPTSSSKLYVGTSGEGLYTSSDIGANWRMASTGLPRTMPITAVQLGAPNTGRIYVGTSTGGLFTSADNGATWASIYAGLPRLPVNAVAFNPESPDTLYVAMDALPASFGAERGGVYKSSDGGTSWHDLLLANSFDGGYINTLAIRSHHPDTIYVGSSSARVYKSTDGGESWTEASDGLPTGSESWYGEANSLGAGHLTTLVVIPTYANVLYVGTGDGVYKSVSGGKHWFHASQGLPPNVAITSLAIDPAMRTTLYAGLASSSTGQNYNHIYKSVDGGVTWAASANGLPPYADVSALTVDRRTSAVVYAGTRFQGIYASSDGGANWSLLNDGLPSNSMGFYKEIYTLVAHTSGLVMGNDNGVWELPIGPDTPLPTVTLTDTPLPTATATTWVDITVTPTTWVPEATETIPPGTPLPTATATTWVDITVTPTVTVTPTMKNQRPTATATVEAP